MICAMSSGFSRRTKPTAASCASRSLSSMLALVSMSSDRAIGSCALLKKVTSCFTPSSKTTKSPCSSEVTKLRD